jgi:two-component system chemotaxis response regulator CheB
LAANHAARQENGMVHRDILAIGASAGGFDALRFLAREFPRDFPASVLVVIHLPAAIPSTLDAILTQVGPLPASFAEDGEAMKRGHIYLAPRERHLLVDGDKLQLGSGPRENNTRPAIDPLMRSVALCCGSRAIGAVLTGTLGDGASGLHALKTSGGVAVVQDPADAAFPEMPAAALSRVKPDHVVSLAAMPALFSKLVREPVGPAKPVPDDVKYEVEIARSGRAIMRNMDHFGRRSVLACPDCHGVMWEIDEGDLVRYRCHVGHAYTAELLSLSLDENLTRALGSALRALDERLFLARRLGDQAREKGLNHVAESWAEKAQEFEKEAQVIRRAIRRIDELAVLSGKGQSPRPAQSPPRPAKRGEGGGEAAE